MAVGVGGIGVGDWAIRGKGVEVGNGVEVGSGIAEKVKEIEKKIRVDSSVIRYLTVKYKALDTKNEFFKKNNKDS